MDADQADIREQILNASARLFVLRGYDGISMREIAEACRISKAGIYYHFKDKEDLFFAILNTNLNRLENLWAMAVGTETGCRTRITSFTRSLFEQLGSDQRAVIRLANQELMKFSPDRREAFALRYQNAFLIPLSTEFQAGMTAGEIKAQDPHLLVWVLLGILYPFFSPSSETRPEASLAAVDLALTIFFEGAAL